MNKLTEKLILLVLLFGGLAYGIYWCVQNGPCGNICNYVPAWLASLLGCQSGPPGTGPGNLGGTANAGILKDFDDLLNKLEGQSSTPSCSSSDFGSCGQPSPGVDNGVATIGGS